MERLRGVHKVVARFSTKHVFVRYDPTKQTASSLIKVVKKLGYKASVDPKAKWPKKKKKKSGYIAAQTRS